MTDQSTIDHYNANADDYDRHVSTAGDSPFHSLYEKPAIQNALPDVTGFSVLSIGCGSGVDTQWLVEHGASRVVGIDISANLIDIAKRRYPKREFHEMDMESLTFADFEFDLLYSSLAIHYLDDWTTALKEALRVLKPGGAYVFSCNHPVESAQEHVDTELSKSVLLGRSVERATEARTIYGNYLSADGNGTRKLTTRVNGMAVVMFHKTFGAMVREITAAGFVIERVIEPQPLPNMQTVDPKHYEQLTRNPTFMIWVLRKPAD